MAATDETLFTATRRLMRELRICEAHGGLMSVQLLTVANQVDIQLDKERARQKAAAAKEQADG
jgi:hypothetical protein